MIFFNNMFCRHAHYQGVLLPACTRGFRKIKRVEDPELTKTKPVYQYVKNKITSKNRVYSWGFAATGALGNPNFLSPVDRKKPLENYNRPHHLGMLSNMKVVIAQIILFD